MQQKQEMLSTQLKSEIRSLVIGFSFMLLLIFVELAPREPPMRLLVADEVTDVGVHLGEDKSDVVSETNLTASYGLDGRGSALVIVCEGCLVLCIEIILSMYFQAKNT